MILISVWYQNASISRILEPSPQGLISSVLKLKFYNKIWVNRNLEHNSIVRNRCTPGINTLKK